MFSLNALRTAALLLGTCLGQLFSTVAEASPANSLPPIDARVYSCDYLFKDVSSKAVVLILGDASIARGNLDPAVGNVRVFARNPINGLCYPSGKELPGVSGSEGSPWIRSANLLLEKKVRDRILLAPLLVASSPVHAWQPTDGSIFERLDTLLNALSALNLTIDAIIWQHGQQNEPALKDPQIYANAFKDLLNVIRDKGISAPVLMAPTGHCPGSQEGAVIAAQTQIINTVPGVIAGPRLASFGAEYLHPEGCALNQVGLERYAQAWAELLRQQLTRK